LITFVFSKSLPIIVSITEELDDNMISVVIDNDESTVEFVDITEHEVWFDFIN